MPLRFHQAVALISVTQLAFAGLNVCQAYAIIDLMNPNLAFQLLKTVFGSSFFVVLFLAKKEPFQKQALLALSSKFSISFILCCISLALFQMTVIVTIDTLGTSVFAIAIASTGAVAYMLNLILGVEHVVVKKLIGSILSVAGACCAVYVTWDKHENRHDPILGTIAMTIMIFSCVGYYMFQKSLYPTFSVVFVTTTTLWVACFFMCIAILGWSRQFDIRWDDSQTLLCLAYSAFVGQFMLYITSNAANRALSAPMICLTAGIQPIATPWMDLLRFCYFPDADPFQCKSPPFAIIICCFMVCIGLALFAWGEHDILQEIRRDNPGYNRFRCGSSTVTEMYSESFIEPLLDMIGKDSSKISDDTFDSMLGERSHTLTPIKERFLQALSYEIKRDNSLIGLQNKVYSI